MAGLHKPVNQPEPEPPFRPEDAFSAEADVLPDDSLAMRQPIKASANDDWESAFRSQETPTVDQPDDIWRPQYNPPPSAAAYWRPFILDSLVVGAALVAIGIFAARAMVWESVPAARPRAEIASA